MGVNGGYAALECGLVESRGHSGQIVLTFLESFAQNINTRKKMFWMCVYFKMQSFQRHAWKCLIGSNRNSLAGMSTY